MPRAKERITEVIQAQPGDAMYEEIMRGLAFERTIERGPYDSRQGKVVSNEEMERHMRMTSGGRTTHTNWRQSIIIR